MEWKKNCKENSVMKINKVKTKWNQNKNKNKIKAKATKENKLKVKFKKEITCQFSATVQM